MLKNKKGLHKRRRRSRQRQRGGGDVGGARVGDAAVERRGERQAAVARTNAARVCRRVIPVPRVWCATSPHSATMTEAALRHARDAAACDGNGIHDDASHELEVCSCAACYSS